jgi:hypothetical protein
MMAAEREPAIVAELGRPETPEEAADRRAESSRNRRANQTLFNLVVATVASLLVVLFLVVVVVRPDSATTTPVDYRSIAADAQSGTSEPLIAPILPSGWYANDAQFGTTAGVLSWYVGLVTPSTQFIAINQGINANPTWLAGILGSGAATGATTIGGIAWTVYDHRTDKNPGNLAYALSGTLGASTVVLHGTASDDEFATLAATLVAQRGTQ